MKHRAAKVARGQTPPVGLVRTQRRGRWRHHAPHDNAQRWVISYADFMTLLFAYFVVMFASVTSSSSTTTPALERLQLALAETLLTESLTVNSSFTAPGVTLREPRLAAL